MQLKVFFLNYIFADKKQEEYAYMNLIPLILNSPQRNKIYKTGQKESESKPNKHTKTQCITHQQTSKQRNDTIPAHGSICCQSPSLCFKVKFYVTLPYFQKVCSFAFIFVINVVHHKAA